MKKEEASANSEQEKANQKNDDYFGYDLYKERRPEKGSWLESCSSFFWRRDYEKQACETKVLKALKTNPMVRILLNALDSAGCHVDIGRNICCEECDSRVTGGYDSEWNQIVICQNSKKATHMSEVTLIHELIHMFDYCVNDINFRNIDHLACTEIRAANLSHCSFLSSFLLKQSSLFNIKQTHQYCVKMKATQSLMVSRNMNFETALKCVLKVFDKCYNDLEPIGRRIRRNSSDPLLAYDESLRYGYGKPTKDYDI